MKFLDIIAFKRYICRFGNLNMLKGSPFKIFDVQIKWAYRIIPQSQTSGMMQIVEGMDATRHERLIDKEIDSKGGWSMSEKWGWNEIYSNYLVSDEKRKILLVIEKTVERVVGMKVEQHSQY